MNLQYSFLALSQVDFFQNEVLEEVLRERAAYFANHERRPLDFWIVVSPKFLMENKNLISQIMMSRYFQQNKETICDSEGNLCLCFVISSNIKFLNWLKLRLGDFDELNSSNVLLNEKTLAYVSNGLVGKISLPLNTEQIQNHFTSQFNYLHPLIDPRLKEINTIKSLR